MGEFWERRGKRNEEWGKVQPVENSKARALQLEGTGPVLQRGEKNN